MSLLDGKLKITAIHSGGDWCDAGADYLILPDGMRFEEEHAEREKWYAAEYYTALKRGEKPQYISMVEWLKQRGAVEPTDDQLTVVWND